MLRIALGNASSSGAPTSRMNPARQTSRTPRLSSSCATARSNSSRDGKRSMVHDQRLDARAGRTRQTRRRSARFEMTTAMRASSWPSAMASMSAWRLLPRPEISTPIVRFDASGPRDRSLASTDIRNRRRRRRRCGSTPIVAAPVSPPARRSFRTLKASFAATARISPMPMLNVRACRQKGRRQPAGAIRRSAGTRHADRSITACVFAGRMRGRFSVMPPPVMCAIPLIAPDASSGRITGRYVRCGISSASPIDVSEPGNARSNIEPGDVECNPAGQ